MSMLERDIEKKCLHLAKKRGALLPKWSSPSSRGVPDRILITNSKVIFIEFKRPGGKMTPLQEKWRKDIHAQGCWHEVIDAVEDFEELLNAIS